MPDQIPPNVLVVMSDQHHPRFMGCAGHPLLHTPNLDRLAARGTRLASAYCNFPLCGPSRMSFMTSRYASEIGCMTNHDHLRSDTPTFAHAFGAAGYDTILCGRMHFNGPDQRHGFKQRIVGDVSDHVRFSPAQALKVTLDFLSDTTGPNARSIRKSGRGACGYLAYDENVADGAVRWLRDRSNQSADAPFMMTVGFVEPHAPFVAYPEDFDRYNERIDADDLPAAHPESLHPELRSFQRMAGLEDAEPVAVEDQRRARVAYHGMCTFVDRQLGRVLDALDEAGLSENTIVIYTSDHGEQLGEHGMWWKHTFYEGSVGVPMVLAGPGVPRGRVVNEHVSLLDVGPTLLDLAGAPALPEASGRSFRCLLEGDPSAWPNEVFAENYWSSASDQVHHMVRRGPWKLNRYPGHEPQLFNLKDDPNELRDRAQDASCAEVRRELAARLDAWRGEHPAQPSPMAPEGVRQWIHEAQRHSDLPWIDAPWCDPEDPPVNRLDPVDSLTESNV